MQTTQGNLFTRPDTFFGICEGLGEDTRIPANLIRISLAVMLFFNAAAAFALYGALGVLVLFTRLLFPNPKPAAATALAAAELPEPNAAAEAQTAEMRLAA